MKWSKNVLKTKKVEKRPNFVLGLLRFRDCKTNANPSPKYRHVTTWKTQLTCYI